MPTLSGSISFLITLFLFGACIFVHEWGHFLVARRCGLKVLRFSIGFGPALLKWVRDGIEYRISILPLGGYVLLPQMNPADAIEGKSDEPSESLPPVSSWRKILVAFAGPAMNVVFAAALAWVIYLYGIPSADSPESQMITQILPESTEYASGLRMGDRVVQVDGVRCRKSSDMELVVTCTKEKIPFQVERDGKLLSFDVDVERDPELGVRIPKFKLGESTYICYLETGKVADRAGLKVGDKIVSVNGVPVLNSNQMTKELGKYHDVQVTLAYEREKVSHSMVVVPFYDAALKRGRIGIQIGDNPMLPKTIIHPPVLQQLEDPLVQVMRVLNALFHPKMTGVTPMKLGGVPSIFTRMKQEMDIGLMGGFSFAVFLNVNLAILNLLPIPVLDGGHILLSLFEWVRRRPLNAKFVQGTWTVCAIALIGFMILINVKDVWFQTRSYFVSHDKPETNAVQSVTPPTPVPAK